MQLKSRQNNKKKAMKVISTRKSSIRFLAVTK